MLQFLATLPKEQLHPLLVHFPIGLWITGTLLYVLSLVGPLKWLRTPAIVMGVLGSVFGWLAVETGEMAAHSVGAALCDNLLLEDHEHQAETAQIFFAASWGLAALFQIVKARFSNGNDTNPVIRILISFGLVMGASYTVLAGHKGFRLVYEDGAGVRAPIKRCTAR